MKTRIFGFTLLEMLITIALFSSIMSVLLGTFFQFNKQDKRIESIFKLRQEARILEKIIRDDLQSSIYLTQFMSDPLKEMDGRKSGIYGVDEDLGEVKADQLHMHVNKRARFYRGLPLNRDPHIHEVSYYLEEQQEGIYLFFRREEFYIDSDITEGEESITHSLSNNVRSFNVRYYKGIEEEPSDMWDSAEYETRKDPKLKIPAGVEVSIQLVDDNKEKLDYVFQINLHPYMGSRITWK